MLFQHRDGELRLIEHGNNATTYHFEILFIDANLSGPVGRAQTEERVVLDRGISDSNAHYVQGGDAPKFEPVALTFSCRLADTPHSQAFREAMSGASKILITSTSGSTSRTQFYTRKGKGVVPMGIDNLTALPTFADTEYKMCYRVEVLYSGTSTWGVAWDEVYFPPMEQTVAESEDAFTMNLNGQVYGDVTRITAFLTGTTAIVG